MKELDFSTYARALLGGRDGKVIIPGSLKDSKLVQVQSAGGHPGQFDKAELKKIIEWITTGAFEK